MLHLTRATVQSFKSVLKCIVLYTYYLVYSIMYALEIIVAMTYTDLRCF